MAAAKATTFKIDVGPANEEEELITTSEFRNYLVMKLKVNGKPLLSPDMSAKDAKTDGDALPVDAKAGITVSVDGDVVSVTAAAGGLSKRYLKYLSKRYIASIGGREFLRIVATTKDSYTIKQIRTEEKGEEEEEEEEA